METENIFEIGLYIASGLGILGYYVIWAMDTYTNWSNYDKDTFEIVSSFLVGWIVGGIVGVFAYVLSPLLILVGIVSLIRHATRRKKKDDLSNVVHDRPSSFY